MDRKSIVEIKKLLSFTYNHFFARFGCLTDTQISVIRNVFENQNILLVAPTASGKTEAIMAPLWEKILLQNNKEQLNKSPAQINIVVVTPTKALVNDLYRRLETIAKKLNIKIKRRTGDHLELTQKNLAHIVITTPESLDSLLTRHPGIFTSLKALVIDEIHLLSGIPRGDQVKFLISRLNKISKFNVYGLSATVENPFRIASLFIPQPFELIEVKNEINFSSFFKSYQNEKDISLIAIETLKQGIAKKVLIFVNTRNQAESLTLQIKAASNQIPILIHHSSLSAEQKDEVEKRLLRERVAICISTTTLELGIDIGSIDATILIDPPNDISSFWQRIGRSGRRVKEPKVICCYSNSFSKKRFEHLIDYSRRAFFDENKNNILNEYYPFFPSTIVQQSLSLCWQNKKKWINHQALWDRMPQEAQKTYNKEMIKEILDNLKDNDWLIFNNGIYSPGEKLEQSMIRGTVHSLIKDSKDIEVVEESTGKILGHLGRVKNKLGHITMGGKIREIASFKNQRLVVKNIGDYSYSPAFYSSSIPLIKRTIAQDFVQYLGLKKNTAYILKNNFYHFQGTLWGVVLFLLFNPNLTLEKTDYSFVIPFFSDIEELKNRFFQLDDIIKDNIKLIWKYLPSTPYEKYVPKVMKQEWIKKFLGDDFKNYLQNLNIEFLCDDNNNQIFNDNSV